MYGIYDANGKTVTIFIDNTVSTLSIERMLRDRCYALTCALLKEAKQTRQTIEIAAIAKEVEKNERESNEAIEQGNLKKALAALLDMDSWIRKTPIFLTSPNTDTEGIFKKIDKIYDDAWDAYKKVSGTS